VTGVVFLAVGVCLGLLGCAPGPSGTKGGSGGSSSGSGGSGSGGNGQTGTGGSSSGSGGSGSGGSGSGGSGSGGSGSGGNGAGTGGAGTGGGGGRQVTGSGGQVVGSGGRAGNGAGGQSTSGGGRGGAGGVTGVGGGAQGSGGTSTAAASCLDGKMNGTETGVDCGGSCAACPNYKINPPNLKNNAQSGCNGGQGFMCTRSMTFSPEFKQAAMDDWSSGDPPFVYGVVGHDKDSGALDTQSGNTCCQCYQLVFDTPKDAVSGLPTPKPMIVQAFNTAAGGAKNFDIFMATGGEGANTAGCSAQYSQFPTTGEPNNGGIRPLNFASQCATMNKFTEASIAASMCQDQLSSQCMMIQASSAASVQSTSQDSCIETNQPENLYHLNWNVRAKRVECPTSLTRVTGCKLNNQSLPMPDPTAKDTASATNGFMSGYGTTTMQDCCRPTCAYSGANNVNPSSADSSYGAFYTCDKSGNPS
jgi:hypothetical protein